MHRRMATSIIYKSMGALVYLLQIIFLTSITNKIVSLIILALLSILATVNCFTIENEEYEIGFKGPDGALDFVGVLNRGKDHPKHIDAGTIVPNAWCLWIPAAEKGKGKWERIEAKSENKAIAKVEPHKFELLEEYCRMIEKYAKDAKDALQRVEDYLTKTNKMMDESHKMREEAHKRNMEQMKQLQQQTEQMVYQKLQELAQTPVTYYSAQCRWPGYNTMPPQQMYQPQIPRGGRY
ncbi:hypothetical protein Ddc_14639 [Ditylenchus destructor]|nr:hypothetical protein Ddc_14639 [Ditylenchus destructor]